jgi:hypothetical protein
MFIYYPYGDALIRPLNSDLNTASPYELYTGSPTFKDTTVYVNFWNKPEDGSVA